MYMFAIVLNASIRLLLYYLQVYAHIFLVLICKDVFVLLYICECEIECIWALEFLMIKHYLYAL